MATYILDITLGYQCNFRCKYCFEQKSSIAYTKTEYSEKVFNRTIEYIDYLLNNVFNKHDKLCITFYGGEPLLYIDTILKYTTTLKGKIYKYNIVTNGYLVDKYIDKLLFIRSSGCSLKINVSYDYILQNKNRQDYTYNKVRNNIKLLHNNGFKCNTITVFPYEDLKYFDQVFIDCLELQKELPKLHSFFNVDRSKTSGTSFNEEECIYGFKKVQEYLSKNNLDNCLMYNGRCGNRNDREKLCMTGNVYASIDIDGNIYPTYNVIFTRPEIQKLMCYGSIFDNFDNITIYRNNLLNNLNFTLPDKCLHCNTPCRVFPWSTIKTDISEFNGLPSEEHCNVHKFINKYLGCNCHVSN